MTRTTASERPASWTDPVPTSMGARVCWAILAGGAALLATGYVRYARAAWFFQDDFLLMDRFRESLHPSGPSAVQDTGRLLSTNVYWFVGNHLFGPNATWYFLANALLLVAVGALIFAIMKPLVGSIPAATASLTFLALPAVIEGYEWIANSQHIVAYLGCFGFVYLFLRADALGHLSAGRAAALVGVFVLAILSNAFAVGLVALPLLAVVLSPRWGRGPANLVLGGVCSMAAVLLVVKARSTGDEAYQLSFTRSTASLNLGFYFHRWWVLGAWILATAVGLAWSCARRDLARSSLFVSSVVFLLPFTFLLYQRYPHYVVMAMTCSMLAFWSVGFPAVRQVDGRLVLPLATAVAVVAVALGLRTLTRGIDAPTGADQARLVSQVAAITAQEPGANHICFDVPAVANTSGLDAWDIPQFWWHTGFGTSFRTFVDDTKSYELRHEAQTCDLVLAVQPDGSVSRATS